MYCARCGAEVGEQARECPSCGADLWGSGALRLTSTSEPAKSLDDVFGGSRTGGATAAGLGGSGTAPGTEGMAQPPAEWFTDPVVTRTEPHASPDEPEVRQRFVPMPDPDQDAWLRVRSAVVVGAAILVAGVLLWVFHHLVTSTFTRDDAAPAANRSATPAPSAARTTSAAPKPSVTPTPSAPRTRHVTGTIPSSAKDCGNGVGAGSGTSCEFAREVAKKVPDWPKDSFKVTATSPKTGNTYTVNCVAGAMTVCTGGRSVVIYVLK